MNASTKKAGEFFKESREELRKVNWPTREETIRLTAFVIVFSLIIAAFLGALDMLFIRILDKVII
ncbi:MAG: preprotein translocase subunit SecE [Nanoarchaeota archaeon]|nr:preprotein translocase subunit SecE [Nanoarchaeota archaeon]